MNNADKQYFEIVNKVLSEGVSKDDRTGVGTISYFGVNARFNLKEGFPLLTTKKVNFEFIKDELFWFLSGSTNINDLPEKTRMIWKDWANKDGDIGKGYGKQWRNVNYFRGFGYGSDEYENYKKAVVKSGKNISDGVIQYVSINEYKEIRQTLKANLYQYKIDQIKQVQHLLKTNPDSRRTILSAWNVSEIDEMNLPPCHAFVQFYVQSNKLSCSLYQRSVDVCLGLPFNIASYSLLTYMFAKVCNMEVGDFVWNGGDVHIYKNHVDGIKKQLQRQPFNLPTIDIKGDFDDIDEIKRENIILNNYQHHPYIKFEIAV